MEHYFNIEVASRYGIEQAIILHTLYYWLRKNALTGKAIEEGKVWTFSSAKTFAEWFPYIKQDKFYRILNGLISNGVIEKGNFNRNQFDRTAWYTLTEFGWNELASCNYDISFLKNLNIHFENLQNGSLSSLTSYKDNIKDIKEDSKKDNIILSDTDMFVLKKDANGNLKLTTEDIFNEWWNLYDKKVSKDQCRKVWDKMKQEDKENCLRATPAYVRATPYKAYRKDPLTYLHRRAWEDEIIAKPMFNQPTKSQIQDYERQEREREIAERMARMLAADEQERVNDGVYATEAIRDM